MNLRVGLRPSFIVRDDSDKFVDDEPREFTKIGYAPTRPPQESEFVETRVEGDPEVALSWSDILENCPDPEVFGAEATCDS